MIARRRPFGAAESSASGLGRAECGRLRGEPVNDRIPGYALQDKLGEGGMGVVYRARQLESGRDVAVKVLSPRAAATPQDVGRFMREAILLSQLRHPAICQLVDSGETENGRFVLATELLRGRTLAALLQRQGALPPRRAVGIALQIARGLEAAHERQVVHCDVKPANVMLVRGDKVKILDFGLARITHVESMDQGLVAGTVAYASPELLRGERGDPRIDLWSLGAVLQELVTGKPPFRGAKRADVVAAVLDGSRAPLDELEPPVAAVFEPVLTRAREVEIGDRDAAAGELAGELERLLAELPEDPVDETASTLELETRPAAGPSSSLWSRVRDLWSSKR